MVSSLQRIALGIALLLTATTVAAQTKKPATPAAKLNKLLTALDQTDSKAWDAHLATLRAQLSRHQKRAQALSAQVAKEQQLAKKVQAEITRLSQMRKLMRPATKSKPAKKASPVATAKKKPVAKKPATKKATKRPPSKKASPAKKPAPKKPAPKKSATSKSPAPGMQPSAKLELITYDDHVQDIFMDNCSGCHDPDEKKGGLDLTTFAAARAGGGSGTTIIAGDPERSRLYRLVTHQARPAMPPNEPKLADDKLELIRKWILAGAPETKADGAAFLAKRNAPRKSKVLKVRFDKPAPMPRNWAAVTPATTTHPVGVRTLAASTRSPLLAIPGLRQVFVVETTKRQTVGVLPFPHGEVETLAFSADCSRLLVAGGKPGKRGRVSLFDVGSGKLLNTYGREFDSVLAAALHPQLTHVALGGTRKRLRVYDVGDRSMLYEVKDHNDWVLCADFSRDGKLLASSSRDGSVAVTRVKDGRNVHVLRRHAGAVHQVRFAPDGASLVSAGEDRTLRGFQLDNGNQRWQRSVGTPVKAIGFSQDGKLLAAGGADGRPRLYRSSGSPIATLPSVGDWIYAIAFSQDGKQLFVGNWRGVTSVFDVKTRKRIATMTPSAPRVIGKAN